MKINCETFTLKLTPDSDPIIFETGKKARQANGSIWAMQGGSVVLATAVSNKSPDAYTDFFPLTINYIEKYYAVGKFPGGFIKRETKPGDRETLTSRLIDRPLRPMFPDGYRNETQVVLTVLSGDNVNMPDMLSINAASAALLISDIPFTTPVGAVRVGIIDGQYVINPSLSQYDSLSLNMIVAGTEDAIVMVEAGMQNISEEKIVDALIYAHEYIKKLVRFQLEIAAKVGKPKNNFVDYSINKDAVNHCLIKYESAIADSFNCDSKEEREEALSEVKERFTEEMKSEIGEDAYQSNKLFYNDLFSEVLKVVFRNHLVKDGRRIDKRAFDEIRPIDIETTLLPSGHGSALFTRGQTQALVVATLGSKSDAQTVESIEGVTLKRFSLQYNFPPFSVGETGRMGAPGRREIGHGALAERAVSSLIPSDSEFPYTLRVVSEILESNGSSSMASVCGASLALMDAGVPIREHVAGIAMGLVTHDGQYAILTDIMGLEDHLGDMDFKVAGTASGVTALQMDIKIKGLSREILEKALEQAKRGRLFILDKMNNVIDKPRPELPITAPRFHTININPEKIGMLIGPQGKNIKAIVEATGANIDILDAGVINIFAYSGESLQKVIDMIEGSVAEAVEGKTYTSTVKKVMEYGAFVEILPGLEGLLHVSQYAHERTANIADVLKVGDRVDVMYMGKDRNGRIELSRKALLPKPDKKEGV